jgi:hypothetical protein
MPPAGIGAAGTGTRIFDERSGPGDVSGSPGPGRQADPAASNEGSSLGNKQRYPGHAHEQSHPLIGELQRPGYQQW